MIKNVLAEKKIEVVIKQCYNINNLRGCNGLDGDGLNVDSELGGHHPVSKVNLLFKYKSKQRLRSGGLSQPLPSASRTDGDRGQTRDT